MESAMILSPSGYAKLLRDVRQLIDEGKLRAGTAAGRELILTYWGIGKRLVEGDLSQNSGYFMSILEDMSGEFDVDVSTLQRSIQFYQTYPDPKEISSLNWSQYKLLLPIVDDKKRKFYESLAQKDGLSCRSLRNAIKNKKFETVTPALSEKTKGTQITRPSEPTYIYKAIVERVIDGDTLLIKLDLGFQVWREQRLRLAQIDAPAMDKPGGKEAYQYVRNALAAVDFIMVKTNKIDIYGRYIGDVFYAPGEISKEKVFTNGHYLNEELVERNLAGLY